MGDYLVKEKRCTQCEKMLPINDFYKHGEYRDSACKECTKARNRRYYRENAVTLKKKQLDRYHSDPEYRQSVLNSAKQRHDNNAFSGLKELILERDDYKCQKCGLSQEKQIEKYGFDLNVHHIDGNGRDDDNPNNDPENLITLCHACHLKEHIPSIDGSKNPKAKLTESDVKEIRELAETLSKAEIARRYNVSWSAIYNVITRRTWKHVK